MLTTLWTRQRLTRQRAGARRIKAAEDLAAEPLEVLELLVSAPEDSTAVRLEPRPAAAHAKPGLPSGRRPIKTMSPPKPNTTNGHHNGHHKWTTNRKNWQTFARTGKTCQAGKASKLAMALLLEAFARATRSFMFPNAVCKTNLVLPTLEIKDPQIKDRHHCELVLPRIGELAVSANDTARRGYVPCTGCSRHRSCGSRAGAWRPPSSGK